MTEGHGDVGIELVAEAQQGLHRLRVGDRRLLDYLVEHFLYGVDVHEAMKSKGCDTKRHMTRHPALDTYPARVQPHQGH